MGVKSWYLIKSFIFRFISIFRTFNADFVFIHREATPIGPPFIEWFNAKVLRKKLIYDFDDAIWLTDKHAESTIERILRWRNKVPSICQWSYKVSCGNDYLLSYALQFNRNVVKNPTTIDTEDLHSLRYKNTTKDTSRITIGWTGSHSTLKYLYLLEEVLRQLQTNHPNVDLLVIADKRPSLNISRMIFKEWSKATEADDLALIDIGIMPLPDDEWSKGKCGFKALQYMALEIPAVISPVGVNASIVQHGVNGFLCAMDSEWLYCLGLLIQDENLRSTLGKEGRKTVIDQFSVSSNTSNFLSLFE